MHANANIRERSARQYAVLWSASGGAGSGRLEVHPDRFELSGKSAVLTVPFDDVADAHIARGAGDRLSGLPVLSLRRLDGEGVRIASLEGTGALYEIARLVEGGGPPLRASGT